MIEVDRLTLQRIDPRRLGDYLIVMKLIVDPGTGGVLSCVRNRNNSQEPDSETRDRNQEQSQINKSRKQE